MSIAEEMTSGFICTNCGVPFTKEHGYPVYCRPCFKAWRDYNHAGKKQLLREIGCQVAIYEKDSGQ